MTAPERGLSVNTVTVGLLLVFGCGSAAARLGPRAGQTLAAGMPAAKQLSAADLINGDLGH